MQFARKPENVVLHQPPTMSPPPPSTSPPIVEGKDPLLEPKDNKLATPTWSQKLENLLPH